MEIISRDLIVVSMEASTKEEVIRKLTELLFKEQRISSAEVFYHDVMLREKEFTTGFGDGFAIPHGKSDAVIHTSLVAAKSNEPIEWASMDDKPVTFIFLIAVPLEAEGNTHLKMLSVLAENLMDDEVKKNLKLLDRKEELYRYIQSLIGGNIL